MTLAGKMIGVTCSIEPFSLSVTTTANTKLRGIVPKGTPNEFSITDPFMKLKVPIVVQLLFVEHLHALALFLILFLENLPKPMVEGEPALLDPPPDYAK